MEVLNVRIWDIPAHKLCRQHLLGEHRELHAIWSILTQGKKGYTRHPETLRWCGKLNALYLRHDTLVWEMTRRGYNHASPLAKTLATGKMTQDVLVDTYEDQIRILQEKGCDCDVRWTDVTECELANSIRKSLSERG
jgi:hypothetical protein